MTFRDDMAEVLDTGLKSRIYVREGTGRCALFILGDFQLWDPYTEVLTYNLGKGEIEQQRAPQLFGFERVEDWRGLTATEAENLAYYLGDDELDLDLVGSVQ